MVDVHCHLNFKAFDQDLDEVIKGAFDAGVTKIINVGADLNSSKKAIELAEKYEEFYATVGIHPHHTDKLETDWEERLEELGKHPKVVAIGECGMDFYNYASNGIADEKLQEELFVKQIELSSRLKLPLMIHNRHAGQKILEILINHKSYLLNPPGMFHCISGDIELLKSALKMGFYIGFDGNITYKGVAKGETTPLSTLVRETPIDKILTETDSPYLTPIPFRGQKNKPEYVIIVGREIAKIKNIPFKEVQEKTTRNTDLLFKL
ncbi:MAG: TatD family hydrolase [Candidatus Levybacteria bacterium]|nr:TatD family hydrolase [Candidatus Levybacteria bacterium]